MKRSTRLMWAAAVIAMLGGLQVMPTAWAAPGTDMVVPTNTWNEQCGAGIASNTLCRTDNASVAYYMDSSGEYELESADRDAVRGAIARYNDNTHLTISYDSSPVFSGAGETDLIWQEGEFGLPDYVRGVTWCNDPQDGSRHLCDQHYIRIRGAGTYNQRIAAHEAGHAWGLTHGAQASPVQGQCEAVMGIMRASLDCLPDATLGDMVRANVNWVY